MIRPTQGILGWLSARASAVAGLAARLRNGWISRTEEPLQSRRELSERFRRELQELVDDKELGPAAAERIAADLFERDEGGDRLKLAVYQSYLKERTGSIGPFLVRSGARIDGENPDGDV